MPRPALNKVTTSIEIPMTPEDKQAFIKWCKLNNLTMAEVIREEIYPLVQQGYNI